MKFSLNEWNFIKHCIETASKKYEEIMQECKPSNNETSFYQIYKRQMEQANIIIEKIENAKI